MSAPANKTIVITGATDGLGRQVARDPAARDTTLLLHGRRREKGQAILREIEEAAGHHKVMYYNADFFSLAAARRLADAIQADQKHLDVLINNAGLGAGPRGARREESADGFELRFAVNCLAPFLLTHRRLPLLRRSVPARIVNVASVGQEPIDFDNVMLEQGYNSLRAYRRSKLAVDE